MKVINAYKRVNHIHVSTHVDESVAHIMHQEYHKTLCGRTTTGRIYTESEIMYPTCKRCLYRLKKQESEESNE
jgi:hypothetical protein